MVFRLWGSYAGGGFVGGLWMDESRCLSLYGGLNSSRVVSVSVRSFVLSLRLMGVSGIRIEVLVLFWWFRFMYVYEEIFFWLVGVVCLFGILGLFYRYKFWSFWVFCGFR